MSFLRCFVKAVLVVACLGCSRNDPVKIGMVAGLSGRMSQLGVSARNAVQLAVAQANEEGGINGRQIELIIRDNQGDPVLCGQAIRELADLGVAGIIGPLMSKMATSVLETIEKKPVVVISPDAVKAAPGFVAAYAYDATQVLLAGLRQSPGLTPDDIKKHFRDLRNQERTKA